MKGILFCFIFLGLSALAYGQDKRPPKKVKQLNTIVNDSLSTRPIERKSRDVKKTQAVISDYLIYRKDTTHVDTTISIKKEYKYNYLRKDNFNLIQFANIGQTYNTLSFDAADRQVIPLFGARARHFNYMEIEDINYYRVPTPFTELFYKTAFEQGQVLDAFFTVNTSRQFNFSIAYKGLRSLGKYQNALTSTGNFRFTTNYTTKNRRYSMRGHIVMQDLLNQENGGLKDEDIEQFTSGNEEFLDRSVFDPNFENAENILEGKRFYLDHEYVVIKPKDSTSSNRLSVSNVVSFDDKYFQFYQTSPTTAFFGDAFTSNINSTVTLENLYSNLGVNYSNRIIGDLNFNVEYRNVNYGYNSVVVLNNQNIRNRIKTDFFGVSGSYKKTIKNIKLEGALGINLSDDIKGNFLDGSIAYQLNDDIQLAGGININSRLPNYNHLLYQSDYINYNWDNFDAFENVNTQQLSFAVRSDKYANASLDISNIDNYTFFNLEDNINGVRVVKPKQYSESLQYLRLKVEKEFRVGKFALDNTIMYQNVVSDEDVLNVPTIITRNTLYFTDQLFRKALTIQTGIVFNYFSEYNMNGYDPLLAEFYTQNETKLGGFPRLDFFVNAKVRQTRIFFKAEHFNSSFTGYDFFSAPNHPYRDFSVRFGLVWDFFL